MEDDEDDILSGEEVLAILHGSGIPMQTLNQCAAILQDWMEGDESDSRIAIVKIAKVLADAKAEGKP